MDGRSWIWSGVCRSMHPGDNLPDNLQSSAEFCRKPAAHHNIHLHATHTTHIKYPPHTRPQQLHGHGHTRGKGHLLTKTTQSTETSPSHPRPHEPHHTPTHTHNNHCTNDLHVTTPPAQGNSALYANRDAILPSRCHAACRYAATRTGRRHRCLNHVLRQGLPCKGDYQRHEPRRTSSPRGLDGHCNWISRARDTLAPLQTFTRSRPEGFQVQRDV